MKSALITDCHFGVKTDNDNMLNYYEKFFQETFFPYLIEHNIKHIFDLGDIFHNRHRINTKTLARAKSMFFDRAAREGIDIDVLLGNHDVHYLNTNKVNTPSLTLSEYQNITIHEEAVQWNDDILLVPWINKENAQHVQATLKKSKARLVLGHFEIAGFYMNKFQKAEHGMKPSVFKKFKQVLSGHFHTKSVNGNITYLGSPFQHTWIDCGETKFFHVIDHDTLKLTPIENPHSAFEIVTYEGVDIEDVKQHKGKSLRVYAENVESQSHFNEFIKQLELVADEVSIVHNHKTTHNEDLEEIEEVQVQDTLTIIEKAVADKDVCKILTDSYKDVV